MSDTLFRGLLLLLCIAPLPFGAHRPWAWSVLGLIVGALLCLWAVGVARRQIRLAIPFSATLPFLVPGLLVMAWVIVQAAVPMPAPLAHPLWTEAAVALGQPIANSSISIDPAASWSALQRCFTYGGVFWLALQFGRDRERAYIGLRWLARAAVAYATYGLIIFFANLDVILWYPKWAYIGDLTSSFVNRNAFAAYAGLGMLICLALAIHALYRAKGGASKTSQVGLRDKVTIIVTEAGAALVGMIILGTALLLSHSRGGFLAAGIGFIALVIAGTMARLIAGRFAAFLLLALLGLGGVLVAMSGETTLERLLESNELEGDRGALFRLSSDAITDAPWGGHGFGAFTAAFKSYRDVTLPRPVLYDYAHSMPLEQAMELGVPAAIVLLVGILIAVGFCIAGIFRRRRGLIHPALAIAATALLSFHNLVDFSIANPAIAAVFAYLLGVGIAQSWPSGQFSTNEIEQETNSTD